MIELIVATGLTAVVCAAVAGSFGFILRETARATIRASVSIQVADAVERMRPTVEDAVVCQSVVLANGTNGLECIMPMDKSGTLYSPIRIDGQGAARYRAGDSYMFYLSDISGSLSKTGTVLWRATKPYGSVTWTPDTTWSLYYGSAVGRVYSLGKFTFAIDSAGSNVTLDLTIGEAYGGSALKGALAAGTESLSVKRIIYYRNWKT